MKKIRIRKEIANPVKQYEESASSFWFDDIDTDFTYTVNNKKQIDYTMNAITGLKGLDPTLKVIKPEDFAFQFKQR